MARAFLPAVRPLFLLFRETRLGEGAVFIACLERFLFRPGATVLALTIGARVVVGSVVPSVVVLRSVFPVSSLPLSSGNSLFATGESLALTAVGDVSLCCALAASCTCCVTARENATRCDRNRVEMPNRNKEATTNVTPTTGAQVLQENFFSRLSPPDFARGRFLRGGTKSASLVALQTQQWPLLVVELEDEPLQLPSFSCECGPRKENDAEL
ncbi:hypothetical protein MTO96_037453 [Rhipicephalus appendiculatus]